MATQTPDLVISRKDLAVLLEYSCTIPTGTIIGKRWRRNVHFGTRIDPEWMIGEYIEDPDPKMVGIKWYWACSEPGKVHRGKLR